jgi:hypothetical protein
LTALQAFAGRCSLNRNPFGYLVVGYKDVAHV